MRKRTMLLTVLSVASLTGCGGQDVQAPDLVESAPVSMLAADQWSTPVHLDAPVNSSFGELGGTFSRDGLSLYYGSNRPGLGGFDIWVTRRDCRDCPWGAPVNLGANVNSAGGDGGAAFTPDGRTMIFSSARAGGFGGEDLWLTYRDDPNDDLGWGPPVNLGPGVNSAANEQLPRLFHRGVGDGAADLVFSRAGVHFQTHMERDGSVTVSALPIAALNSPVNAAEDVFMDGREVIVFGANRAGGLGLSDIWMSSRRNPNEPWSAPRNLGAVINTAGADLQPGLSWDGRTLVFAAGANARPSLGAQDLWISTRSP